MFSMRGDQESRQSEMGWQRGAKEEGTLVTQTVTHVYVTHMWLIGCPNLYKLQESREFTFLRVFNPKMK